MVCKNCGAYVEDGAAFCGACGVPTVHGEFYAEFCPVCGSEVEPGTVFCGNCGCKIFDDYNNVYQRPGRAQNGSRNNALIFVLSGIAVLLVIICTAVFLLMYNSKDVSSGVFITTTPSSYTQTTEPKLASEEPLITYETQEPETEPSGIGNGEYLMSTDKRYITFRELQMYSKEQVAFIRNEIYARHGYIFKSEPYKSYFESKDWYIPNPYFDESMFSEIERKNKSTIVEFEKSMGWR